MSDERWEAADYAEVQMDGREGGELPPGRASFQVTHSAKECVWDLGAGRLVERCFPSLSARSISPGVTTRDCFFAHPNPGEAERSSEL